jgi:hypothetical protein
MDKKVLYSNFYHILLQVKADLLIRYGQERFNCFRGTFHNFYHTKCRYFARKNRNISPEKITGPPQKVTRGPQSRGPGAIPPPFSAGLTTANEICSAWLLVYCKRKRSQKVDRALILHWMEIRLYAMLHDRVTNQNAGFCNSMCQ